MKQPICVRCPTCGNREFTTVRPATIVAVQSDRKCTACGTSYTPPTPTWAAVVFIVIGAVLTAGCVLSIAIAIARGGIAGLPMNLAFAALGTVCVRYGMTQLREKGVMAPEPFGPEPVPLIQSFKQWMRKSARGLAALACIAVFDG